MGGKNHLHKGNYVFKFEKGEGENNSRETTIQGNTVCIGNLKLLLAQAV